MMYSYIQKSFNESQSEPYDAIFYIVEVVVVPVLVVIDVKHLKNISGLCKRSSCFSVIYEANRLARRL